MSSSSTGPREQQLQTPTSVTQSQPPVPDCASAGDIEDRLKFLRHVRACITTLAAQWPGVDTVNVMAAAHVTAERLRSHAKLAPGARIPDGVEQPGNIVVTIHSSPMNHECVRQMIECGVENMLPPDHELCAFASLILPVHCESRVYKLLASSKRSDSVHTCSSAQA